MKILGINNYGSIPHLSNSKLGAGDYYVNFGMEKILTEKKRDKHDIIYVYEKYDGSNIGIAKMDDKIFALTRSGYEAKTSPYKLHHKFNDWVYRNENIFKELLKNGERITGEWLIQATGIIYEITGEPILFFDYFNSENKRVIQDEFLEKISNYELNTPRLLHKGESIKVETLLPKLNERTENFKSIEKPEGMIYRVERNGKVDFLAKWVRGDFSTGKYIINVEEKDLVMNILK